MLAAAISGALNARRRASYYYAQISANIGLVPFFTPLNPFFSKASLKWWQGAVALTLRAGNCVHTRAAIFNVLLVLGDNMSVSRAPHSLKQTTTNFYAKKLIFFKIRARDFFFKNVAYFSLLHTPLIWSQYAVHFAFNNALTSVSYMWRLFTFYGNFFLKVRAR